MTRKLKGIVAIIFVGMLIYFVSSANTLVAEDAENESQEQFAGATISVEASLVAVELEVFEKIIGEPDIENLNSMPLEKIIMQCVHEDEGEVVSVVKLAVVNGHEGEMSREENVEEQRKVPEEEFSVQEEIKNHVSFRVIPEIIDINRIAVSFDFKQIVFEGSLSTESEVEEQSERNIVIETSSTVVLCPGQPRIVSVTKKDEAIFLIMGVDI